MTSENVLLELTSSGMSLVNDARQTPDEPPENVIMRALALLRAVKPYVDHEALVVMDPNAPMEDDLVQLDFSPRADEPSRVSAG